MAQHQTRASEVLGDYIGIGLIAESWALVDARYLALALIALSLRR